MKIGLIGIFLFLSVNVMANHLVTNGDRILVVAPHPDDEVLGTSGILVQVAEKLKQNEDVDLRVIVMTCGDGYSTALRKLQNSGVDYDLDRDSDIDFVDLGIKRQRETLQAMDALSIPRDKVVFLGLPDGGLENIYNSQKSYTSPYTKQSTNPYHFSSLYGKSYSRQVVKDELLRIISSFKPNKVYTPTLTDHHPDHYTTRNFVKLTLEELSSTAEHYEYLIHWERYHHRWPESSPLWPTVITGHIAPDFELAFAPINWSMEEKRDVISLYESQVAIDGWYLYPFAKESEVFWLSRPQRNDYLR